MPLKIFTRLVVFAVLSLNSAITEAETLCSLIYDKNHKNFISNEGACDQLYSPASTFKIALSLIGFDSGYLKNTELPAIPYSSEYVATLPSHQNVTSPSYWMKYSVVWYSQLLTQSLGVERFQHYVNSFGYGNQNLTGDPGKNNGLTRAWLSSSLKISPYQQIRFLEKLIDRELPVSESAYLYTETILKDDTDQYANLFGKTGSVVFPQDKEGRVLLDSQLGWYVGWLKKNDNHYIFATLIKEPKKSGVFSGPKAKELTLSLLNKIN